MNHDDDKHIEAALRDAAQRKPDLEAKSAAISAAMAAFDAAHPAPEDSAVEASQPAGTLNSNVRQGIFRRGRLRVNTHNSGRRPMNTQTNRWLYSGVAAASVLVISVVVSQQYPSNLNLLPSDLKDEDTQQSVAQFDGLDEAAMPMRTERASEPMVMHEQERQRVEEQVAKHEMKKSNALKRMASESMAQEYSQPAPVKSITPTSPQDIIAPPGYQAAGRDDFEVIEDNPVQRVSDQLVSTFSVDVDTASYSFVRRQLHQGVLPQKDAVRTEEMVNYFDYAYPAPQNRSEPFATNVVVSDSPWKVGNKLMHIGIKGYEISTAAKPNTNLVFLLDVSGSMNSPDKLPLVKQSLELLLSQLGENDSVAIAVYAGAAGTVLEPTPASEKQKIMNALNQLQAGGSTAGGEGIKLAYQLASANFDKDAVNRVILATDGDFNVGITNRDELKGFVEREREKGIYLSVLGFGQGNYHDHLMQELAQNGNGVAAYIDTLSEAQKVLVTEATSSLFPIAQDVKIQVEFNPDTVAEYRLIGYETRALAREDFNNDAVDAGDIGAGHTVTAIYEITPVGGDTLIDPLRYAKSATAEKAQSEEYAFVKLRYKLPGEKTSKLIEHPVAVGNTAESDRALAPWVLREAQFASAVAGFSQLLRGGQYTGDWSYDDALALAQANKGEDLYGYRTEFVQLIRKAKIAKGM